MPKKGKPQKQISQKKKSNERRRFASSQAVPGNLASVSLQRVGSACCHAHCIVAPSAASINMSSESRFSGDEDFWYARASSSRGVCVRVGVASVNEHLSGPAKRN